jgi:glutathione S-transferase
MMGKLSLIAFQPRGANMTSNDIHSSGAGQARTLTAFRPVPEFVRGLVRDVRVRWALEEAGLSYQVKLIGSADQNTPAYRSLQPFGQVPAYQDGTLALFESGAIVHHIAARCAVLMPQDEAGRSRTLTWMFAALNSVEPVVQMLGEIDLFAAGEPWAKERRPAVMERVEERLGDLDRQLTDSEYLLDRFTAADILMTTVLHNLRHTDLVSKFPSLHAYYQRCNARSAARKAMADHMALFQSVAR